MATTRLQILKSRTTKLSRDKSILTGILLDVMIRFREYLLDLQKLQLEEGENNKGQVVGRYSRATEIASLFGPPPRPIKPKREGEPYNFEWTGDYFDGMRIFRRNDSIIITSRDSKADLLELKYRDLLGLQEESLAEAISQKIAPATVRDFKTYLLK